MFGRRACELVKEVANCTPHTLPQYNDESVRLVTDEIHEHRAALNELLNKVVEAEQERQGDTGNVEPDWSRYPEDAAASVVHHHSILRNKRLLLIYTNERLERIKTLRWQQRRLPDDVEPQLSPSEQEFFKQYDRVLRNYSSHGTGVGMDLTLDEVPPKGLRERVRVVQGQGEVMMSVGPVRLTAGSVHTLPRTEVEPLIRAGILEPLDLVSF